MKKFVCKSYSLYDYLSKRGHVPLATSRDKFNCKMYVWIYNHTDELQYDLEVFFAAHTKNN